MAIINTDNDNVPNNDNMTITTADILIHPVRMRILQALGDHTLMTQELADRLPDIPKSSVYRHLRILLEHEFVSIAATQMIRGIEEKQYQLARSPYLNAADTAGMTTDDHARAFATYLLLVQQGFANYLSQINGQGKPVDFVADRAGYTEVIVQASDAEFDTLTSAINEAVMPLLHNPAGGVRRPRKLIVITHPEMS